MARTREQMIRHYGVVMKGIIADAAVIRRRGGELAIALEVAFSQAEVVLGQLIDEVKGVPNAGPEPEAKRADLPGTTGRPANPNRGGQVPQVGQGPPGSGLAP